MSAAGGVETAVEEFVRASSFKFEPATAGDHRMNGLIENFWRGLVDGANCLLKDGGLRDEFWVDAVMAFVHQANCLPTSTNVLGGGVAPYESLGIRAYHPEVLRPFGALGEVKLPGEPVDEAGNIGSAANKKRIVVHLGYSADGKSYTVLDPDRRIIYTSRLANVESSF